MKKALVFLLLMCMSLGSVPAYAEKSPWTEGVTYMDKAFGKFEFGLLNFLGGWSEIMTRPAIYTDNDKNVLLGIGHGFLNAALFTAGGAAHLATFPIPIDIPLPGGGVAADENYE